MWVDERETGGKMNIRGMEIMKVDEFRCVGSTMENNRGEEVQAGWRVHWTKDTEDIDAAGQKEEKDH